MAGSRTSPQRGIWYGEYSGCNRLRAGVTRCTPGAQVHQHTEVSTAPQVDRTAAFQSVFQVMDRCNEVNQSLRVKRFTHVIPSTQILLVVQAEIERDRLAARPVGGARCGEHIGDIGEDANNERAVLTLVDLAVNAPLPAQIVGCGCVCSGRSTGLPLTAGHAAPPAEVRRLI